MPDPVSCTAQASSSSMCRWFLARLDNNDKPSFSFLYRSLSIAVITLIYCKASIIFREDNRSAIHW